MNAKPKRRFGAHVSISGGLDKAVERVAAIGGNCLQIFSGSPRGWQKRFPGKAEIKRFKQLCQENDVVPVWLHAKYLINLASDKKSLVKLSRLSLIHDLRVSQLIGAQGVIVHLGSHQGRGFSAVKQQLIQEIKRILQASPTTTKLIVENTAGQQGKIPSHLEEISLILSSVGSQRLGWWLDSCHAFAGGYSLGKVSGNTLIENDILIRAKKLGISSRLTGVHINDSKAGFDSHRDAHESLGKGQLGLTGLRTYVNHPQLKHLPMIIETPFHRPGDDKKNLQILKSLVDD